MEYLEKLLKDSYKLQEQKPEKSAFWHLQQLRQEIKNAKAEYLEKSDIQYAVFKNYGGEDFTQISIWFKDISKAENYIKEFGKIGKKGVFVILSKTS